MPMDLWHLHIFCKVVECRSFSRAGEAVHLSQPTVSSHIRDLEAHFSCRLIDRLAREAVPTKAGELLYDYARRLIALRQEAETALSCFQGTMKGRLKIGGSTIPGTYLIPRVIGSFKVRFPDVTISLIIGATDTIIEATLAGDLELGVVGATSDNQNIFQAPLIEDEMCLIIPADHPWSRKKKIEINQLMKAPFIVRERGSGTLKTIQQSLSRQAVQLDDFNVVAEMGSTEAVCQAVKCGVGVSIVSRMAVAEALKTGVLKALTIAGCPLQRHFYLTRHKYRSLSPIGNAFVGHINKALD